LTTAVGIAARLPRQVLSLVDRAFALRRAWRGTSIERRRYGPEGLGVELRIGSVGVGPFQARAQSALAGHLLEHPLNWFWFLTTDDSGDESLAERALRPAVVNRKGRGGNRTGTARRQQSSDVRPPHCAQRARPALRLPLRALCHPHAATHRQCER